MAHPNRTVLERALKLDWIPELKAKGFRGRPWKFFREREDFVDVVYLEFQRSGGACRILLGVEPRNFPAATKETSPTRIPMTERMKTSRSARFSTMRRKHGFSMPIGLSHSRNT